MERNDEGIAYFCERVERCRDDVDLLLLYGSYLTGDAGPRSDVDLCFVPATERGWQVAETFIPAGRLRPVRQAWTGRASSGSPSSPSR
ncbi:nucleotidyltransferase domain-containing protein [Tessaracoccus flavescens]|uniref:nucleotidyltransferase domain-containing protein n=1 Tax=Tessaracoccus flavescens TaxID=399497 RepID=UPI0012602A18